jgi:biopolymer transport protein ExbB
MENPVVDATAPVVAAAPAATDNPYGFEALINHGTGISYTVLAILAIMSLTSYYIFITKFYDQWKIGKAAKRVEKQFWAASSPKEGAEKLPRDDDFRVIAESAIRAASHHEGRLNDRISLNDWLAMALQRSVDALRSRLSTGLSWLATVGSTAPFVGLFGTVYGILNALVTIGLSGQPSIDKVAGPVGEALIMTALGLFVAVPAVFFYNILLGRNKAIFDMLREFTGDLESYLIGGIRPEIGAPGARPAAAPAPAAVRK